MKQFLKQFLSLSLLISSFAQANTTFINRSQGRYAIHQDAGSVGHTHDVQNEMENWWGTAKATVGYQQSFDDRQIARMLFGSDLISTQTSSSTGCGTRGHHGHAIKVQGSTVANRNANAWLADYMYLPTDFDSTLSFRPRIQSFFADLTLFVGLDEWWEGGYFQVHGPIAWSRSDLRLEETVVAAGSTNGNYPAGYFSPAAIVNTSLLSNVRAYMSGQAPFSGSLTQADTATAPVSQTITFQPLNYAKMNCGSNHETGFADLRAELGWNFWRNEDYHLGVNIQAAAPTGNKYHAEHLFHAVVGNGKHWELGGGLTGHYVFYRSSSGEKHFGFYADVNVTHLFKVSGLRTFDLKGLPNSKYMLAAQFGPNTQNLSTNNQASVATKQFADVYAPVANLTTLKVGSTSAAQVDMVANFNYSCKHFSWDLGYNFYYRSAEHIDCPSDCEPCDNTVNLCTSGQANTWALKGDSKMFGFASAANTTAPTIQQLQAIPLSATNSAATIHGGSNIGGTVTPTNNANLKVDNAQPAFAGGTTAPTALYNNPTGTVAVNTSIQPVFLSCAQIDTHGTQSMSHSVFTHLQYNFEAGDDWTPYLGVGAMGEFGMNHHEGQGRCNSTTVATTTTTTACSSKNDHRSAAVSNWGVWVQGGISFS